MSAEDAADAAAPKTLSQWAKLNEPWEIQKMIEGGADPSAGNRIGQTALHVACIWGNHKCVEVLIKARAEVRGRAFAFTAREP